MPGKEISNTVFVAGHDDFRERVLVNHRIFNLS